MGLLWPRLELTVTISKVAFWFLIYSAFAILAAYLMAAIWGAGNTTMPLAAGAARGNAFQELAIKAVGDSSAPTGIIAFVLIFWGLRVGGGAPLGGGGPWWAKGRSEDFCLKKPG